MALLFPGTETKTGGNPEDSRKTDIKTDETLLEDPRYQTVYDFILAEEGYAPIGKKDRDAFRAGYGSDTITHEDGSYSDVTEGMEYSKEAAERDFARRLTGEFLPRVRHSVGKEVFDSLDANLLAILTSLTYNYGHIRPEVLNALKTGDREDVALAIQGLNPEDTQLVPRRQREGEFLRLPFTDLFPPSAEDQGWEGVPHKLPEDFVSDRPMSGLLASILPVEGIPVMGQSVEGTRMGNLNEVRGLLGDK